MRKQKGKRKKEKNKKGSNKECKLDDTNKKEERNGIIVEVKEKVE